MSKKEKFVDDNREVVEVIRCWVNSYIGKDDEDGAYNAAVLLTSFTELIKNYLVVRMMAKADHDKLN